MNDCPCNILNGGFCERHQIRKSRHWVDLCHNNPRWWTAWEAGTGPGQKQNPKPRVFKDGPGTQLHKMLERCGIQVTKTCQCKSRIRTMNKCGPDTCRENVTCIVDWLEEEARKRELPFNRWLARLLVLRAIAKARRAERKWRAKDSPATSATPPQPPGCG